jgi:L-lactate dehydrogenase
VELDDYCAVCERKCEDLEKQEIAEKVRNSAYHIIEYKGATNYGIAQSLLRIVGAVIRDENSVLTVSSLVEDYMGIEDVCMSIPCLVAREGIVRRLQTDLPDEEARKLRESAEKLKEFQDQVESDEE